MIKNYIYYFVLFLIVALTVTGIYFNSVQSKETLEQIAYEQWEEDDEEDDDYDSDEDFDDYDGYAYSVEQGIHETTDTCTHFRNSEEDADYETDKYEDYEADIVEYCNGDMSKIQQ